MNQQIAQLQDSDPEFARTLKRLRVASYGLAAAIVLAAGLGLWAVVVNSEQATQITKIQKTPCTLDAEGKACTTIKERIARHGSLKNPCIEHQRVEGTKGRNCPQFYVRPSQREVQANSKEVQNLELGSEGQPPNAAGGRTGGVGPSHGDSTEPPAPGKGGAKGGEAPAITPAPAQTPASAQPAPQPEPEAPPAVEPTPTPNAPGLLGNPGGTVGEVLCSVNALGIRVCGE